MRPLAIDLFCGLGGWTDGFLAEGYDVVGFDIERHDYGTGGYPGQLVIQDVTTLDGAQFKDAAVIVASPPCQEFSYMAMPWSRARQIAGALQGEISLDGLMVPFPEGYEGSRTTAELTRLFDACFRIQREACEAAGRYIPLVVENVKGAQRWVGKAQANFGSYYLWGDVAMIDRRVIAGPLTFGVGVEPMKAQKRNPDGTGHGTGSWFKIADSKERGASAAKVPGFRFDGSGRSFQTASVEASMSGVKAPGMNWSDQSRRGQDFTRLAGQHAIKVPSTSGRRTDKGNGARFTSREGRMEGVKGFTPNGERMGKNRVARLAGSKSSARKAASAMIAKIPFALAQYIAHTYKTQPLELRRLAR